MVINMIYINELPAIMQDQFVTELLKKLGDMFGSETFLTTAMLADKLESAFDTGIELKETLRAFKNDLEDYAYCLFTGKTAYVIIDILDIAEDTVLAAFQQDIESLANCIYRLIDKSDILVKVEPGFTNIVNYISELYYEKMNMSL